MLLNEELMIPIISHRAIPLLFFWFSMSFLVYKNMSAGEWGNYRHFSFPCLLAGRWGWGDLVWICSGWLLTLLSSFSMCVVGPFYSGVSIWVFSVSLSFSSVLSAFFSRLRSSFSSFFFFFSSSLCLFSNWWLVFLKGFLLCA